MKNFIISLLLFTTSTFAQIRVIYQLNFKTDSLATEYDSEIFNLDIDHDASIFYPSSFIQIDSLISIGRYLHNDQVPEPKLDFIVEKKDNKTLFYQMVGMTNYSVLDDRKLNWKLINDKSKNSSEVDTILGFKVREANVSFAGRNWIAFYAPEIPYSDGPYKFRGLPGLLLKLYDEKLHYIFEIIGLRKIKKVYDNSIMKRMKQYGMQTIEVSMNDYKKIVNKVNKNPKVVSYEIQGNTSLNIPKEIADEISESRSKKISKNNPIELSLE